MRMLVGVSSLTRRLVLTTARALRLPHLTSSFILLPYLSPSKRLCCDIQCAGQATVWLVAHRLLCLAVLPGWILQSFASYFITHHSGPSRH